MKKTIAHSIACFLAFACCIFAANNELTSFTISEALVQEYDNTSKLADTADIFKKLDSRIGVYYMDRYEMAKDLQQAISDYPQFHKLVNDFSLTGSAVTIKLLDRIPPEDSIIDRIWLRSIQMDTLKNYIRQEAIRLSNSHTISKFLNNMKGIVFADSMMMRRYAISLFAASLGVCYDTSGTYQNVKDVLWTDSEIEDLFRTNSKLPVYPTKKQQKNVVFDNAQHLLDHINNHYRRPNCSEERLHNAFALLDTLYSILLENIVNTTTYQERDFDDTKPIVWNGTGCSRKDQLNGEIIGIYPYWFAGDTTKRIDFSAITRISFYGMYADASGHLHMPSGSRALAYLGQKGFSNFVSEAHKHDVKMDWIVEKSDWREIKNHQSLEKFLDTLSIEIDSLVRAKSNTIFQRIVNKLSFSEEDYGTRGDGVTLYFKNYPTDSLSTAIFNNFFKKTHQQLLLRNPNAYLNMMVNRTDLAEDIYPLRTDSNTAKAPKGIYSYANFRDIITAPQKEDKTSATTDEIADNLKNLLLIINDEPHSQSQQLILNNLSAQLKGEYRHVVLKAIAPVTWFDNRQWDQLSDNATFYNDSFYNMGIAPYATDIGAANFCGNKGHIGICLNKYFKKDDKDISFSSQIRTEIPFFCTHRWAFRLLNTIVCFLAFVLLLCYFISRAIRTKLDKYFTLFIGAVVALPALTTIILAIFDPAATLLLILPLTVIVISAIAASLRKVFLKAC